MDIKKTISDNKAPIIIGTILIVVAVIYFISPKLKVGSNKESDTKGEDTKGGIIFEKGEETTDVKILSGKTFSGGFRTAWLRYFKKGNRFEILISETSKPSEKVYRGTWKDDGKALFFENGMVFQGTSITDLTTQLRESDKVKVLMAMTF